MKNLSKALLLPIVLMLISCNNPNKQVEKNIKQYTQIWDEIINKRNLEQLNETNFSKDLILHMQPENVVGVENAKNYYKMFLNGFSNIEFKVIDAFGQADKFVTHWNFNGTHTGEFFGIPATGKRVNINGTTLVKMKEGKITEEQDFMDNMIFLQQLGLQSSPENISIVDNAYKAFEAGDMKTVLASLDSTIVWNEAENFPYADGNPYLGPDAVLKGVFTRIGKEWEYFKLTNIQLFEMDNNYVLATGRYQAKYKKNSAIINAQFAHLWKFKDGKVTNFQQFADTKQVADAVKK